MELWKKQKKILAAFGGFFALMYLGTLVSRAVYASGLTQVETETPRRMSLAHQVEASGIVREGQEYAVHTLAGLRVRTVYVQVGERVEEGTLLFDLDTEELEETVPLRSLSHHPLRKSVPELTYSLSQLPGNSDNVLHLYKAISEIPIRRPDSGIFRLLRIHQQTVRWNAVIQWV